MDGVIRRWDILAHPIVTIRCFGWRVFCKSLLAGKRETFLSLLTETGALRPAYNEAPALIGRCVNLELRARGIYELLARRLPCPGPVKEFLETLARHEQGHADLLSVCREEAARVRQDAQSLECWSEVVPRIERRMKEVEESLDAVDRPADALEVVLRVETSEINRAFFGLVAASRSEFVRALRVFWTARDLHLAYICRTIRELDPSLRDHCEELLSGQPL
jgi:rubrerythrin